MIEWISEWLKNIIIIVLLASFVDLLLPSSNMQKYAKVVLGLVIILTIISPILNIVSGDFSINQLINRLENQMNSNDSSNKIVSIDQQQADSEYQKEMIRQVEETMLKNLKKEVEEQLNVSINALNLDATITDENWGIRQITLFVEKKPAGLTEDINDGNNHVEEIKPVQQVNINLSNKDQIFSSEEKEKSVEENQRIIRLIKEFLDKEWGFAEEIIVINLIE